MAELVTMARDSFGAGVKMMKGDVVSVREDGHVYSPSELTSRILVILKVPGDAVSDHADMMTSDFNEDDERVRMRQKKIEDSVVDAGSATFTHAEIEAAKETKPPVE